MVIDMTTVTYIDSTFLREFRVFNGAESEPNQRRW